MEPFLKPDLTQRSATAWAQANCPQTLTSSVPTSAVFLFHRYSRPAHGLTDKRKVLLLHLQGVLDDRDTGVGHQASDGAERLVNLLEDLLDELWVSDVALPRLDLDAVLLGDLGRDLLGVLGRVVDDGDVGRGLGEGLGDGTADTSVTAGDDDGVSGKVDWGSEGVFWGWEGTTAGQVGREWTAGTVTHS